MNVIIDKFGEAAKTEKIDNEHFTVTTEVYVSSRFYGWLFGFTGEIKITSPDEVKEEYKELLKRALYE